MKRLAIAFSGPSNSGKTTTILKVLENFIKQNLKCVVIKHDPGDKACFDVEGKDSFKFSQTGADVVVLSPTRTTYFSKDKSDLDDVIKMIGEFDILLVEGLKTLPLPRISIFKDEIDESYLGFSDAIASYKTDLNYKIENINLDDIDAICAWILKHAKAV
ncbi:molybdopterin-guanine dinucleotide biosynthesis protein B [Campylobacter sp. RM13119]|uniref:Molybdopterin-guanine dinucleotide biosynthesis protein B n=1 Tax=Campylobacter californiensis TaxID=1032243 RepID=A0ABD4JJS1_9BACT|nr:MULTISPECIES: molybdopterin-guanine dinucleotide biosynthesis protein B [unclassified Campylobacter]MBE2986907.1 molybdopterin-guanine dinucleotide biosynthesis protein B [Campylobacter sp. RM12919]MBE2987805.1 molybdopterin-guanine dinucleotide biosynthesis protein B [Campylobacter sp. RM12920]MBE3021497.1 molybdopterin-guanine dinucleotide biosynthesis protein B [Campylobacter sp. 7477a]MBE3605720.1 molybdopterin-guanine dinucleotide biosynthesis protein B [Campylobacter sp. RM13119]MBE36